jgi:isopentenyl diphosphate isomerase/L-lactate dehydrogenase-like FMN-dependent dehydrogenase
MSDLTLEDVRTQAREKLKGICAVYPVCDGAADRICQRENYGKAIGLGGAGLGGSFRANLEALAKVRLNTRVVGPDFVPDSRFDFFGLSLSVPILGASTSGMSAYNNAITEDDFCRATLAGCRQAGTLSWRGDTYFYDEDDHFALRTIAEEGGRGVPIFKPRDQKVLLRLLEKAAALGVPALGVDLDGHGSTNFARAGKAVYRKTPAEIRELASATGLPFIAKGIMHPDDAEACAEAGVAAVVVSNHGGRVLDSTPGTAEVLPRIAERVGRRVMVLADGGVRNGYDVLKMLALGARAVLIGRDLIRAGIGGGAEGVRLQMEHHAKVFRQAMRMTGCRTLADIGPAALA